MKPDKVIEVLERLKSGFMVKHPEYEPLCQAISMIKDLKEVNRKLADLHFENGHEIAELKIKYNKLKASEGLGVEQIAKALYEKQPECLSAISKERRAEACYDIAKAIVEVQTKYKKEKGEI